MFSLYKQNKNSSVYSPGYKILFCYSSKNMTVAIKVFSSVFTKSKPKALNKNNCKLETSICLNVSRGYIKSLHGKLETDIQKSV